MFFLLRIITKIGSGSDFMPFIQRVGVPVIDVAFVRNKVTS